MKQILQFDQLSCRLKVEGLPDVSVGQSGAALGIITGWSLQWAGRPELEGRKEHLLALMQVVLPYARYLISGVPRRFGAEPQPVEIGPASEGGHSLLLRSSQPDTPPLQLALDDAELADLVRVLDQLRLDARLQLPLELPAPVPLRARELLERRPLAQRLAAPLGGVLALALASGLGLLIPEPKPAAAPGRPESSQPARGATPSP
ncbi:DUF4335 domain-containing protein [Cyanobium sp. Alchichica 3B3-8F6]|uniref:DUF4335 domain-containing protein n=1 Tax=Synechococcales TaxID=1890424 RepID=UPI000B98BD70|nr:MULTISPECIES: DUF4335 domain-containing protein [Synechococcales]MCP9881098.1 DUF4335 domain-containing protein [Cyanobium sp. Alchichica 3B3-8F6]MCP9940958.1 DUF4335 domain-containing protein [Cyanobium sp. ATX 6E8]